LDQALAEIYAALLEEGVYHCSIGTMYRLLGQHGEVRERRRQLRHPVYQKPELLAEKPNEVWSWDITKLMGPTKWSYFYLYVILDISAVGWSPGASPMRKAPRCFGRCSRTPLPNTTYYMVNSHCTPIAAPQ
jgi:transposase InsO family protein